MVMGGGIEPIATRLLLKWRKRSSKIVFSTFSASTFPDDPIGGINFLKTDESGVKPLFNHSNINVLAC